MASNRLQEQVIPEQPAVSHILSLLTDAQVPPALPPVSGGQGKLSLLQSGHAGAMTAEVMNPIQALKRTALRFACLPVSVTLFAVGLDLHLNLARSFSAGSVFVIFRITMIFALPVWCLYLRWVIALKDAEEQRMKTILLSGILIGPVSMAIWGLIPQLREGDPLKTWAGDPLIGMGGMAAVASSLIVGSLTTCLYVIGLKILYRDSVSASGS